MAVTVETEWTLSEATRRLKDIVLTEGSAFDERILLAVESFRTTEGEPHFPIRVARSTEHIFGTMPLLIRDGEILVGWHPNTHANVERKDEWDEALTYWGRLLPGVCASEGHMAPDYETILSSGLWGIGQRIIDLEKECNPTDPSTPPKQVFYRSALISLRAFQQLIHRYEELARVMAEEVGDATWRRELMEVAEVCEHIAEHPARTFREAIQLTWFVFLALCIENGTSHGCFGPGRMDQYLYPYYRREKDLGTLDEEQFHALLDQFFIKCNEFSGPSMSAVIMGAGGRKSDGSDATNELSFRMLEASDRVQMYFPGIDVLWHSDMDEKFMHEACRLLRNGKGQPSFFNSDVIVKGLERHGVPREHGVDHLPSTCTETSIMGRSNPWVAWPYVNIPMCLLYAMFDGKHPIKGTQDRLATGIPQSYDELRTAFFNQLEIATQDAIARGNREQHVASMYRPFPLLSCFIQDCVGRGKDISSGGALYNFLQPEAVGISNVVDGLVAIKTLVEDTKRYTLDDIRSALAANWEGWEELQKAILRDCPKHGQDVNWVNDLFAAVAGGWCSNIEGHKNYLGGPVFPGFLGWTVWIGFGNETPATPDGRKAGTPLANSLAQCTGVDITGTPGVMLSTCQLDQSRGLGGITFNARFGTNALATTQGAERLKGLIEASFDVGLYQLQINVASVESLRKAQDNPDAYRDLFVRIGGYLVPFTLLPLDAQEEVIARTELEL